jgi:Domain of unknown function (DUF4442)
VNSGSEIFLRLIKHHLKFRMFLLYKLPAAFFSGVKITEVDENKCSVSIPFKWLTQNPFRSAYFASLSMAAEMSTGVLAMMHIYKRKPAISMLVTKMEANYFKKAIGKTFFLCEDGKQIRDIIEETVRTGEAKTIVVKSVGTNKQGEAIADFYFTWSFKSKTIAFL